MIMKTLEIIATIAGIIFALSMGIIMLTKSDNFGWFLILISLIVVNTVRAELRDLLKNDRGI